MRGSRAARARAAAAAGRPCIDCVERRLGSGARGHPFVQRIRLHGLVWGRCLPSAQQLRAQRLAEDFASAQADAFADVEGGWDPEGGLSDDDTESEASWGDEAWNEPGA